MAAAKDIQTIEDSIAYVRTNFNELFPPAEARRKTLGNIPERLHAELQEFAVERNLTMHEMVAVLWDFHTEYEAENEEKLKTQRAKKRS
jgi:hypothetical protein